MGINLDYTLGRTLKEHTVYLSRGYTKLCDRLRLLNHIGTGDTRVRLR